MMTQPHLDTHGEMLMEQYRERLPIYEQLAERAYERLRKVLRGQGLYVTAIEHRVKSWVCASSPSILTPGLHKL